MARIRSIKPEFWSDDTVTECSLSARLLFIGTWNFADDAGNLDRSAKQIKTRVFPIDNVDCEPLIRELIGHGLLIEYSVAGKKYLHIPGFADHQLINRPSKPVVPGYVETQGALTEGSVSVNGSHVSTHSGGEGRGRDGRGGDGTTLTEDSVSTRTTKVLPSGASSPKTHRGSRIPDDFSLTPELRKYATDRGIDASREFEGFTDYWRSRAGAQALKADWPATWRTWVRRCEASNPKPKGGADNGLPFAN